MLPASAVQELSTLPPNIADGTKAFEHDLMGSYTGLDFILQSRLHHRIVQRKLTPNLGLLSPHLEDELRQSGRRFISQGGQSWLNRSQALSFATLINGANVRKSFCGH